MGGNWTACALVTTSRPVRAFNPPHIDELIAAFASLESSLKSLLSDTITTYLDTGHLEGFEDGVYDAVIQGLIDGSVASKVFQDVPGEPLNNYIEVMPDPNATQPRRTPPRATSRTA